VELLLCGSSSCSSAAMHAHARAVGEAALDGWEAHDGTVAEMRRIRRRGAGCGVGVGVGVTRELCVCVCVICVCVMCVCDVCVCDVCVRVCVVLGVVGAGAG